MRRVSGLSRCRYSIPGKTAHKPSLTSDPL
jgi:hypothetical protein